MNVLNQSTLFEFVDHFWEEAIIESLSTYIEIPNKSPAFDRDWEHHGHMQAAADHMMAWVGQQAVPGLTMELLTLPGRTPTILLEREGDTTETVLIYGHLDKQPEFTGWHEGLAPWRAVRRDDKLYGRGGADDGYAIYSAVAAIKALQAQNLPMPRIVTIIEASEESGSPDLPHYMAMLSDRIGKPSLVIALDSTAGNYDQLWVTTSLRGLIAGELRVDVLDDGAHSGMAGGIVGSSFRIVRQLLSRIEDEDTGEILPSFLNEQIPESRRLEAMMAGKALADDFEHMFNFAGDSGPMSSDPVELVLNNTWLASLEITGIDGIPSLQDAGNVLRPFTTARFSLRLPPTTDVDVAIQEIETLLTDHAPNNVRVSLRLDEPAAGWHAPATSPELAASLAAASNAYFGAAAISLGCGGSIPFMQFLADSLPDAQFVVTGVLGPHSNAHGPNEFLHIPTAKKVTACVAHILHDWTLS